MFDVEGSTIKEVEKRISPCDICAKCFIKNWILKSHDGDVHEQDCVEVSPQFAAVKGTQRDELSEIEEFNNAMYTHEEKKPPEKLSTEDQVVIFSGKEPDVLFKLDIKYENSISRGRKIFPATWAPSLQTRREITSFAKSSHTKDLNPSNLWKKI